MGSMPTKTAMSLLRLSHELPRGSQVHALTTYTTPARKRQPLAEAVLEHPLWEWLLLVDADMVVPSDAALRLLRHDAGIASGVYVCRHYPASLEAGKLVEQDEEPDPRPLDTPAMNIQPLRPEDVEGVTEVDVAGGGCLLIRAEVLEALDPPWFEPDVSLHRDFGQSSDWNFCLRAREVGFRILLDPGVECGHVGSKVHYPGEG
jgi:GT2 family glycosyltransferase